MTHQFLTGNVHISQICQSGNTCLAVAVVLEFSLWQLEIVFPVVILASEVHTGTTILSHRVVVVNHNLTTKFTTGNLLAGTCVTESVDYQVVLLWQHHELHAVFPVTQTVVTEVLTDKVCSCRRFFFGRILNYLRLCFLYSLCLDDVGVGTLSHRNRCRKGESRQNNQFLHRYLY